MSVINIILPYLNHDCLREIRLVSKRACYECAKYMNMKFVLRNYRSFDEHHYLVGNSIVKISDPKYCDRSTVHTDKIIYAKTITSIMKLKSYYKNVVDLEHICIEHGINNIILELWKEDKFVDYFYHASRAAQKDNLEIIKYIIEKTQPTKYLQRLIFREAYNSKSVNVVKFICNCSVINSEYVLKIIKEAEVLDPNVMDFLLDKFSIGFSDFLYQSNLFYHILRKNQIEALRYLCQKVNICDIVVIKPEYFNVILIEGHLEIVDLLLSHGITLENIMYPYNLDQIISIMIRSSADVIYYLIKTNISQTFNAINVAKAAVEFGNVELVKFLIDRNMITIEKCNELNNNLTVIHFKMIQFLMHNGLPLNKINYFKCHDHELIDFLHDNYPEKLNWNKFSNCLFEIEKIEYLIFKMPCLNDISELDISYLIHTNNVKCLQMMAMKGIKFNLQHLKNSIWKANYCATNFFISQGLSMEKYWREINFKETLISISSFGCLEFLKMVLDYLTKKQKKKLMMMAGIKGTVIIFEFLDKIVSLPNKAIRKIFFRACREGNIKMFSYFCNHGLVEKYCKDSNFKALRFASRVNSISIVKYLSDFLTINEIIKSKAFDEAILSNSIDVVRYLYGCGISTNYVCKDNHYFLRRCLDTEQSCVLQWYLDNEIDVTNIKFTSYEVINIINSFNFVNIEFALSFCTLEDLKKNHYQIVKSSLPYYSIFLLMVNKGLTHDDLVALAPHVPSENPYFKAFFYRQGIII